MKKIIKDTLVLFAITLIAGFLLGGVYKITKAPIDAQAKAKTEKAYKAVFYKYFDKVTDAPGAADKIVDEFSFVQWSADEVAALNDSFMANLGGNTSNVLDSVVTAYGEENKLSGYVMTITNSEAYGGSIQMSVGILADGTVAGVEILSISETPGLGMNAQSDSFLDQFTAVLTDAFEYTKTGRQASDEIDAISSATYTTKSMTHGVNAAIAAYKAIESSGIEGGAVNE